MISFLLALQFLTIIPLKIKEVREKKLASAAIYFPFVGLLLGLLLSGINIVLGILNLPALVINIFLVVALIAVTGGIHLDGLSDTADALLSGRPKDEMLLIMRDPHIGVMGVLSLISIILLKVGLLFSIDSSTKATALLLMCVLSRWSLVFSMFLSPYARQEGKAKAFISGMNVKISLISTITAIVFAFLIWQIKGLLVLLIISGCTYSGSKFINKKIGGITGDTLGALCELNEITVLLAILILTKSFL